MKTSGTVLLVRIKAILWGLTIFSAFLHLELFHLHRALEEEQQQRELESSNNPFPPKQQQEAAKLIRRTEQEPRTASHPSNTATTSDGTFNGIPMEYHDGASLHDFHSAVHCVGETFHKTSWIHRSCQFRNLCFDTESKEFVLFASPQEARLDKAQQKLQQRGHLFSSSSMMRNTDTTTVSIGAIEIKWEEDLYEMKWFPKVLDAEQELMNRNSNDTTDGGGGYYQLVGDTVLVPFHSLAPFNLGHLLWDSFLPVYTLLSMFQLLPTTTTTKEKQLVLMRYVANKTMWATCEEDTYWKEPCQENFEKTLPLFGVDSFSSTRDVELKYSTSSSSSGSKTSQEGKKSKYVCSKRGAAGIGMLTDHGLGQHGWDKYDYTRTHNYGRGPILYGFRNFMMNNIGMTSRPVRSSAPYTITFAKHSSFDPVRDLDFEIQMEALEQAFATTADGSNQVIIQSYQMHEFSMQEQIRIVAESSIMISACGGGAVTSLFLPEGAGLILFYNEENRSLGYSAAAPRLDFDYYNNAAYLRTHWLPITTMNEPADLDFFVQTVRNELETISLHHVLREQ